MFMLRVISHIWLVYLYGWYCNLLRKWGHIISERSWEGGVAERGDREMEKGSTGMNEVSLNMDACVRVWGKGRRGSWLLNFTYLVCISHFRTMCICIILIVNLPAK